MDFKYLWIGVFARIKSLLSSNFVKTGSSFTTSDHPDNHPEIPPALPTGSLQLNGVTYRLRDTLQIYSLGDKKPPASVLFRDEMNAGFVVMDANSFHILFEERL